MRKALLAAAAACSMIAPSMSHAANSESFTILGPVTPAPSTGTFGAPCATGGFDDDIPQCQKPTYTRLARCAYLTDPGTAQTGRDGVIGYVFKIDATKVRGADREDDRDNKWFSLEVTSAKHVSNTPGKMDVPDVDVAFYADLGVCASDVEVTADVYVPVGGLGPQTLKDSFVARGTYNGLGDEINMSFPSGAYEPLDNPTVIRYASSYYAIVTIFGGTSGPDGTNVKITCKGHGPYLSHPTGNPGDCVNGWYVNA